MTQRHASQNWTGRRPWDGSPLDVMRRLLRAWLYPMFECANCIGMPEHGCYCAATGAISPGEGPEWWRAALRDRLHGVMYPPRRYLTIPADWPGI